MKQQPTPCKFNSNPTAPMKETLLRKTGLNWPSAALALSACLAATAYGQYLPANVCQPGDPIIASSVNSPGTEGVANAIDGTQNKYLNFDLSTGKGLLPAGFVVKPSVGVTWVTGIAMESANDQPVRDP